MSYVWKYWDDAGQHDWPAGDPLPNGADLFNTEFLNQFEEQLNKRIVAINHAAGTFGPLSHSQDPVYVNTGWVRRFYDYLSACLLSGFYCREQTVSECVDDDISSLSLGDLAALYPDHWTLSGPRATKVHSSDPAFTAWEYRSFGQSLGDICGPWIFEDFRLAIMRATITKLPITDSNGPFTRKYKLAGVSDPWPISWTTVSEPSEIHARSIKQDGGSRYSSVTNTIRILHADTWDYFTALSWSIAFYATLPYGSTFDAQGTGLVQNEWYVTNSGTLTVSDGTSFNNYVMDPMPDPPANSSAGGSGFNLIPIGLGFRSAYLMFNVET